MGIMIVSVHVPVPVLLVVDFQEVLKTEVLTKHDNDTEYDERSRDIFGENYARLQALKAQYDPTNMFDKLFAIAPQA